MRENKIDFLERNVSDYSFKISRQELTNTQAIEVFAMMSIIKDMESVGDIIDKNIIPLAGKFQNIHENFSEEGESELNDFHIRVMKQLSRLKEAFGEMRLKTAEKIITKDLKYRNLETEYRITHLKRVQQALTESVATHEVHMELMDLLKQINVYLANIAKTIISMDLPD
jgi:phosphate:Na+ symporter